MTPSAILTRWTPVVAIACAALCGTAVVAGLMSAKLAIVIFLVVELPFWLVCAVFVCRNVHTAKLNGTSTSDALTAVVRLSPAWPIIRSELRLYSALALWVRRRLDVPTGSSPITATSGSVAVPLAFILVTAVELVALHFVIPWAWLRGTVLALSIWSLIAVLGLLAVSRTRPHYLTESHLVLRHRGAVVASIPRNSVAAVSLRQRYIDTVPTIDGDRLVLPTPDGTNVDITLTAPVDASVKGIRPFTTYSRATVSRISIAADHRERLKSLRR